MGFLLLIVASICHEFSEDNKTQTGHFRRFAVGRSAVACWLPWELWNLTTRIGPSIGPESCSSCDTCGWTTIAAMLFWRAAMGQSITPIRLCYLPPVCFSKICWLGPSWKHRGCNKSSQRKSLRPKMQCSLRRAAGSISEGCWSWSLATGTGLRPAKVSRWDWGRYPCLLGQ